VDDKGIMHIRDMIVNGIITGDINGQIQITQNLNVDATFTGNIQAEAEITVPSGAVYRMLAYINVKTLVLSGIFLIWGTGSLRGTYAVGTVSGMAGGVATLNGMQLVTKP
jgi:cytoskeletal protein CcmA (bactofilin family)